MGKYRTYFDKNNTIVLNSDVNTGKNPVSELYYGQLISRFLFYCNFGEIIAKHTAGEFTTATHRLKIKNTSNFDVSQQLSPNNEIVFTNKQRSTSFDLELRATKEHWDEGVGFDFNLNAFAASYPEDNVYNTNPSNWYHGTTIASFFNPGCTLSSVIATQHFDGGDEDVDMDISAFVNGIIASGVTTGITSGTTGTGVTYNYTGFCLKYTNQYETYKFNDGQSRAMGLFTRHTQTYFEPFIETTYNDYINDNRVDFYQNTTNNLFLFVNVNGQITNLDTLPICTINSQTHPVTHVTKGVYSTTLFASGNTFDSYTEYNDVWSGIAIGGHVKPNITLKFVPKEDNDYFQIGSEVMEPVRYGMSISGIKRDEKVPQGNVRKVFVHLRKPYTVDQHDILTNIEYRLYIKQGANQIEVLDWQPVNKTYNSNYFTIDTTWLIPQIYYVDIKIERRGEVNIFNEELKFTVPSKVSY